jgi:hypothetical protein
LICETVCVSQINGVHTLRMAAYLRSLLISRGLDFTNQRPR